MLFVWKLQKFHWPNIFTIEMFIFANFVQKINFEGSQFQDVGVALSEFYLFALGLLRVSGENCLKTPKAPLYEYFYHWKVQFSLTWVSKNWTFEWSQFQWIVVARR